jgi:hypothetical protein
MFASDVRTEHPSFPGYLQGVLRRKVLQVLGPVVWAPVVCPRLADQAGGHVAPDTIHEAPKKDAYCVVDVGHSDEN